MDRYYIIEITPEGLKELASTLTKKVIDSFCQDLSTVRFNLAKTECVLSLKQSAKVPDVLKNSTALSLKEAQSETSKSTWQKKIN